MAARYPQDLHMRNSKFKTSRSRLDSFAKGSESRKISWPGSVQKIDDTNSSLQNASRNARRSVKQKLQNIPFSDLSQEGQKTLFVHLSRGRVTILHGKSYKEQVDVCRIRRQAAAPCVAGPGPGTEKQRDEREPFNKVWQRRAQAQKGKEIRERPGTGCEHTAPLPRQARARSHGTGCGSATWNDEEKMS